MRRPSPDIAARIRNAILAAREGHSVRTAVEIADIPLSTLYWWINRSKGGQSPAWIAEQWQTAVINGSGRTRRACVIARVVALVESGLESGRAAAACNIAPTTIRRWIRRSRAGLAPASFAARWDAAMAARSSQRHWGEECDLCGDICEAGCCSVACCEAGVDFYLHFCCVECRDDFMGDRR
jgi:transposase